jgi:hypothetical protein
MTTLYIRHFYAKLYVVHNKRDMEQFYKILKHLSHIYCKINKNLCRFLLKTVTFLNMCTKFV